MYCNKCGAKVPDDAIFCNKCGAKIFCADAAVMTDVSETDAEPQSQGISEPTSQTSADSIPTNKSTAGSDSVRADFRQFIDSHVQKTTSFRSSEELLKSHVPVIFAWLCLGIPAIALGAMAFNDRDWLMLLPVAFSGVLLGYLPFMIIREVKGIRYSSRFIGRFDKNINTDGLMQFLNEHLSYLRPYWHDWGYIEYEKKSAKSSAFKGLLFGGIGDAIKSGLATANFNAAIDKSTGGFMFSIW